MQKILERISEQLANRRQSGNLRSLAKAFPLIDFASNDYLGIARSTTFSAILQQVSAEYTYPAHGATGSRLITGNSSLTEAVEQELADYFCGEAALLYNSGYAANQGLISSLLHKGDTVIYDELSHACIKDGCRLSVANRYSFRHNDLDHLRQKISKAHGQVFVVVESVYSMDGDEAPLPALVQLCKETGAALIVDEAHSTGLWGPNGAGLCTAYGIEKEVFARIHTFGKAMGIHGACVVGHQTLKDYQINFSRPFIYTTALPAHSILAIREAIRYRTQHPELVGDLFRNVGLFHQRISEKGVQLTDRLVQARGPIQAVMVPGNQAARMAATSIQEQGMAVVPILAPTVPLGEERLRICLHSFNTKEELQQLANALAKIF